jgi:hypothetical protein
MSDFNWCHGPNCHTRETSSRVRGSGDNKVLRTRKVNTKHYWRSGQGSWQYFCDDTCMRDYIETHLTSIIAIAPRREPLETPIKVEKTKSQEYRMRYNGENYEQVPYMATRTTIKSVDNDSG